MFDNWKKKKTVNKVDVGAICDGNVMPITEVPDQVFAEKMLGDGVGFSFDGDVIYAPCNGVISMVSQTNHAIGLKAENDAELLLHIGMDTVTLKGKGLTPLVHKGDKVKTGLPLMKIDRNFMEKKHICLTSPLILTNGDDYELSIVKDSGPVSRHETVFSVTHK